MVVSVTYILYSPLLPNCVSIWLDDHLHVDLFSFTLYFLYLFLLSLTLHLTVVPIKDLLKEDDFFGIDAPAEEVLP